MTLWYEVSLLLLRLRRLLLCSHHIWLLLLLFPLFLVEQILYEKGLLLQQRFSQSVTPAVTTIGTRKGPFGCNKLLKRKLIIPLK